MDPLILILLVVFMGGMLFMSSRSRKKQQAQQDSLQNSLSVGDVVVMTSGVSGTVVDLDDERTLDLEIAPDVVTTWLRGAVREKLSATDTLAPETHAPDAVGSTDTADDAAAVAPAVAPADADTVDAAAPSLRKTGS